MKTEIPGNTLSLPSIIALGYCGVLILISIIDLAVKIDMKKNRTRNTFYLFLWVLIISVLLFFLLKTVSFEIMWIATVPLSFFLGHFFIYTKRKVLSDILIYGMVLAAIMVQLSPFIS
jgi:low temperature requirement protein LtrA